MNTIDFKIILNVFFQFLLIVIQILGNYFLSMTYLKKKKFYALKIVVASILCLMIVFLFTILKIETLDHFIVLPLFELFIFILSIILFFSLYEIELSGLFFISIVPLFFRLIVREIMSIISYYEVLFEYSFWIEVILSLLIFTLLYYSMIKPLKNNLDLYSSSEMNFFTSILLITNCLLLVFENIIIQNSPYVLILTLFECAYTFCMIILYYSLLKQNKSLSDILTIKKLWDDDRRRYEVQKESGELIKIKYHDLKHQIQNFKGKNEITDKMMEELEKNVEIYNSVFKTNNQVVDVILSNFYLRCLNSKVELTSVVDGKLLAFMDDIDIYSLLSNLLDNALEYEKNIMPIENRFVSLNIREFSNGINIHVENYCVEKLNFEEGVLTTTKSDKENHGFGLKSVKKIIEKYHGYFKMFIEDDMVQVNITFPLQERKEL